MRIFSLIISLYLAHVAGAGNFETVFYHKNSGFGQSHVYALLQDQYNYLWIGTQEGLYTFDGQSFKKFTQKDGMAENLVISGFKDSREKLYFGHFSGYLTVYENHTFDSLKLSDELLQPIAFLELQEVVYVLTRNSGIFGIGKDSVMHYTSDELGGKIAVSFATMDKEILISHNEGLLKFNPASGQFRKPEFNDQELGNYFITEQRYQAGCWLWSEKAGLLHLKNDLSLETVITAENIPMNPEFIYEDDYGHLWLGCKTSGLLKLARDPVSHNYNIKNILDESLLKSNQVSCFIQDHEGNYWAGNLGNGLIYLRELKVMNYQNPKLGKPNAIIPYHDEQFIIGTENGLYLSSFMPAANAWVSQPTRWIKDGISVTALFQDKDRILIGTAEEGIFELDLDKNVRPIPFNHRLKKGAVRRITEKDGLIYASISGDGFYQIGTQVNHYSTSTGFIHNEIYDLQVDHKNQLWIAMHANGLSVKNHTKFQHLTINNKTDARDINAVLQDQNKNLWIATAGYGLYKYDDDFNLLKHFNKDAINSDYGFFILQKGQHVYVGTQNGIEKININNDSIEHLHASQTSGQVIPVLNGAAISKQGNIMILNPEGFTVIQQHNPKLVQKNRKLLLTDFKIFNQKTALSKKLPAGNSLDVNEYIKLSPSENHINLEFLNVSFANPDQMVYSFQLNDELNQWTEPVNLNQVTYSNLGAGEYSLQIKSQLIASSNPQYLTISFKIPPPFYQQLWFILLACCSFIGLTYTFYHVKNRNIRLQNKKLEQLVEERTVELKDINNKLLTTQEDVQEKNEQLVHLNNNLEDQVKERTFALKQALSEYDTFLYNASHALKGPVARLKGLTSLIKIEHPEISSNNIQLFDYEQERLLKILNKLTAVHTIFNCTPEREEISLLSIIDAYFSRVKTSFAPEYGKNFNDRTFGHNEIIRIVLENLLENAIMFSKHDSSQHRIQIFSGKRESYNLIEIHDNGIGIEPEVIPNIYKMYYRGSEGSTGNGLGLYLVKKGLDKINGHIEVESEVMKYTRFKVWMPV